MGTSVSTEHVPFSASREGTGREKKNLAISSWVGFVWKNQRLFLTSSNCLQINNNFPHILAISITILRGWDSPYGFVPSPKASFSRFNWQWIGGSPVWGQFIIGAYTVHSTISHDISVLCPFLLKIHVSVFGWKNIMYYLAIVPYLYIYIHIGVYIYIISMFRLILVVYTLW